MTGAPRRPRVLHVATWYPTPTTPLSGGFVRDHVRASAVHADVAVVHLLPRQPGLGRRHQVERVDDEVAPTVEVRYGRGPLALAAAIRGLGVASRTLAAGTGAFDLVHAHVVEAAIPAALLAARRRLPLVVTEHWSIYLPADPGQLGRVLTPLGRWALQRADRVLPVGPALRDAMATVAPRARYEVVPNVVDTDRFQASPPPAGPVTIAAVGLLTVEKGFDVLLEALPAVRRRLPDARVVVAGDGPERAALEARAARLDLGGAVTFAGALDRDGVADLLRRSTLLCAPSRFETFSVVAVEALASGRPVVATRSGGPEAFLTDAQGELVAVDDVEGLAAAIVRVAGRSWEAADLARHAAERFALPVVADRLATIYRTVLEEHR